MAGGDTSQRPNPEMTKAMQAIREMAAALLQQAQQNNQRNDGAVEFQGLSEFRPNNPFQFKRGYDRDKVKLWIQEMEKIFRAMVCTDDQKVTFATFM